jgi:hypothetical protein
MAPWHGSTVRADASKHVADWPAGCGAIAAYPQLTQH